MGEEPKANDVNHSFLSAEPGGFNAQQSLHRIARAKEPWAASTLRYASTECCRCALPACLTRVRAPSDASRRWRQHREFPRVPDKAEVDRNDPAALIEARHQEARDKWVAIMGTRLLREQLRECYLREGVNHLKNCRELAEEYVRRVKDQSDAYQTWDKQVRASRGAHAAGVWHVSNAYARPGRPSHNLGPSPQNHPSTSS